jgi:amidase
MKTRREFVQSSLALGAAAAFPGWSRGLMARAPVASAAGTEELAFADATRIAGAIRSKQVSALAVVEMFQARIERLNPALNAIVTLNDRALERARAADRALADGESWGPLHGVPVVIKDCFETAGIRTTAGFPPLADHVPDEDAVVVARLLAAGAIILGKTNVPTLAMGMRTHNPIFGVTSNPYDLERTPGGSTGGGAAAVAAGLAPLEVGSDNGGSIRIPAHFSGLYGLKLTEGRASDRGHIPVLPGFPPSIRHLNSVGPLARSVDDLELALKVLVGAGRDWEGAPVPLADAPPRTVASLTVGWTDDFGGAPVSRSTRQVLSGLAGELQRRGARVIRTDLAGLDFEEIWETWAELIFMETSAGVPTEIIEGFQDGLGQIVEAGYGDVPVIRAWLRALDEPSTYRRYAEVLARRDRVIAAIEGELGRYDALLCPVVAVPAPLKDPESMTIDVDGTAVLNEAGLGFTVPFNIGGNPVVVVPVTLTDEGLPIGVQVVGRRWTEMELLAVARAISEVLPPVPRPPMAS